MGGMCVPRGVATAVVTAEVRAVARGVSTEEEMARGGAMAMGGTLLVVRPTPWIGSLSQLSVCN